MCTCDHLPLRPWGHGSILFTEMAKQTTPNDTTKVFVRVNKDLWIRTRVFAAKREKTAQWVVNEALADYLQKHEAA